MFIVIRDYKIIYCHFFFFLNREFAEKYVRDEWGANGPSLMQRVTTRICGVKDTKKQSRYKCIAFEVYPRTVFHPVEAIHWWKFFALNSTDFILKKCEESIAVHTWNSHRNYWKVVNERNSAYDILGEKYCPQTFSVAAEDF